MMNKAMEEMMGMLKKYMIDETEENMTVVRGTRKPANRAERRKATAHAKNRRKAMGKYSLNLVDEKTGNIHQTGWKSYFKGDKVYSRKDRRAGKNLEKWYAEDIICGNIDDDDDLILYGEDNDCGIRWNSCHTENDDEDLIGEDDVDVSNNGWVRLDYYNDMVYSMRYWREEAMLYADKMNEMRDEVLEMRKFLMDKGLLCEYLTK